MLSYTIERVIHEYDSTSVRFADTCLRIFLMNQLDGALKGTSSAAIDTLCTLYEHARRESMVSSGTAALGVTSWASRM